MDRISYIFKPKYIEMLYVFKQTNYFPFFPYFFFYNSLVSKCILVEVYNKKKNNSTEITASLPVPV